VNCAEALPLLHANFDSELELVSSMALERHLESCVRCAASYRRLELLRTEIRRAGFASGSEAALERIRANVLPLRSDTRQRPNVWWRGPWVLLPVAAALLLSVAVPRFETDGDRNSRELLDSHLRSLVGDHLVDVPSSDRHTVKPWFQGKVDFSPPVPDLSLAGFELAGGRLDVLDGRKTPALAYRRRNHVINVWLAPGGTRLLTPAFTERDGFQMARWSQGGMAWTAVSDLNAAEMRLFVDKLRAYR